MGSSEEWPGRTGTGSARPPLARGFTAKPLARAAGVWFN